MNLDHAFSMGFKSGEYGGRYAAQCAAPYFTNQVNLTTRKKWTWWKRWVTGSEEEEAGIKNDGIRLRQNVQKSYSLVPVSSHSIVFP